MLKAQLLICGFGPAGASVAAAFTSQGILAEHISVIDISAERANKAREKGHRSICADAANLHGLRVAEAGVIPLIVICVDDASTPAVLASVKEVSPDSTVDVVVRHLEVAKAARAAGAERAIALSDLAGQLLAQSVSLP